MATKIVREAVGVFTDPLHLRAAVDDLLPVFNREQLSFVGDHKLIEQALGEKYTHVGQVADVPNLPRTVVPDDDAGTEGQAALAGGLAYVGAVGAAAVVAAVGAATLPVIAAAAVAGGAAGAFGAVIARWLGKSHADELERHLESGGLLLWVGVQDAMEEQRAQDILRANGARDVHIHTFERDEPYLHQGQSHDLSYMNRIGL